MRIVEVDPARPVRAEEHSEPKEEDEHRQPQPPGQHRCRNSEKKDAPDEKETMLDRVGGRRLHGGIIAARAHHAAEAKRALSVS
jgi:hypothetical protein